MNSDQQVNDGYLIVQNLLRVSAYLSRVGDRISSEYGLNQQQFTILNEICSREEIIQSDLVKDLYYEKSNVSKVVKKLIGLGLLEMKTSEADRRVKFLTPTDEGFAIWKKCLDETIEWGNSWLAHLSSTEITFALRISERFKDSIKEDITEE